MKSKKRTNIQVVTDIMNRNALAQAFIMNAMSTAADATIAGGVEALPASGFVAPEVWIAVATDIQKDLKQHFGGMS